jgi:hypothetical protein
MDHVEFRHGVKEGIILEIDCHQMKQGRTSVSYKVAVSRGGDKEKSLIFSTCVTFVTKWSKACNFLTGSYRIWSRQHETHRDSRYHSWDRSF